MKLHSSVRFRYYPAIVSVLLLATACGDDDDDPMTVTNRNPVAVITATPMEVPENDNNQTFVTLDGSASSDPDNDPLTFAWDVPGGTFELATTATDMIPKVSFPGTAPSTVTLTVSDGQGGSGQASVTIGIVVPVNLAPTAVATASPTSVPFGDNNMTVVTLTGTASTDPENDPLTFSWVVASGTFVNGTTSTSSVAQVTFPGTAPYLVTLTVDDGQGNTNSTQLTVNLS